MRQRRSGRVLFVSSVGGRVPLTAVGPYIASKWALEGLAETLALEVADFGIGVTLLEPGPVSSGALDDVRCYDSTDGAYEHIYAGRTSSMSADGPGASAAAVLAARKAAPEDVAFRP